MTDKHEQKRRDIINTAFEQWSKDLYTKNSLTVIANAMNMTKPGLFRYFSCKEDLYEAMMETFLDDLVNFAQDMLNHVESLNLFDMLGICIRDSIKFFLDNNNKCYYKFFTSPIIKSQILKNSRFIECKKRLSLFFKEKYFQIKNIDLSNDEIDDILMYIFYASTVVFVYYKTMIYKIRSSEITDQKFDTICNYIMDILQNGMSDSFQGEILSSQQLSLIEEEIIKNDYDISRDKLFEAVTSAIAKNGIAGASMDAIAKEMGFNSKSSLYLYFANKESMFEQLFENESSMMVDYIKSNGLRYDNLSKDFYGCMVATFCYFTKNNSVLQYFDWLHYNMVKDEVKLSKDKMIAVFESISNGVKNKYNVMFVNQGENQDMYGVMTVVLLSSFIVRIIVHRNVQNGGRTSAEEVKDLRKIYYLYMNGLAG